MLARLWQLIRPRARRRAKPQGEAPVEAVLGSPRSVGNGAVKSAIEAQMVIAKRDSAVARSRSPLKFVVLVFLLSIPFWLAGAITGGKLSADLPVGALMLVCPTAAAAILVCRESGTAGVIELLRRSFDFERIRAKSWYVPIVLLGPGVYASTYAVMRFTGVAVPDPQFPVLACLAAFVAFFIAGLGEELGWSGYAIDPLQDRWGALRAGLLLGVVWAVWHLVPLLQVGRPIGWIGWWALGTVALRVLLTWVYNNSGKSVFAAALTHAFTNLTWIGPFLDFGSAGYPYDGERISALILAGVAAVVTVVWGPQTLTRRRRPAQNRRRVASVT